MQKIILALLCVFSFGMSNKAFSQNEFITEWVTIDGSITIPTYSYGDPYNYTISWHNKTTGIQLGSETGITGDYTISSLPTDTIVVKISGTFPQFYMFNGSSKTELIHVKQWGNIQWKSFYSSFFDCLNLKTVDSTSPDLSLVEDMSYMFYGAKAFNGDLSSWDVSQVKYMGSMFAYTTVFNQDLSSWDVGQVTYMGNMFANALAFNGDISSWDVSQVSDMYSMFRGAIVFNQDLSSWDVSQVTDMSYMFSNATAFNQDISSWDVSQVNDISAMFAYSTSFNQDLSSWDVSGVTVMSGIFIGAANISYCNMDNILNSWAPVILTKTYNIGNIVSASINSASVRTSLGSRISLQNPEITNPISTSFSVTAPTTQLCVGEQISLTASDANTYLWNGISGNMVNTFAIASDTTFIVKGLESNGCYGIDTVTINSLALPTVTIGSDVTEICFGNDLSLVAEGANTYLWNTQESNSELTVSPTETTTYSVIGTDINGCTNTASIEIIVSECAGLKDNSFELSAYPNPTTDKLTITVQNIDYSEATITLMDMTGKTLFIEKVDTEKTVISISNYPTGIYFVKIQSGEKLLTEKIIKL